MMRGGVLALDYLGQEVRLGSKWGSLRSCKFALGRKGFENKHKQFTRSTYRMNNVNTG